MAHHALDKPSSGSSSLLDLRPLLTETENYFLTGVCGFRLSDSVIQIFCGVQVELSRLLLTFYVREDANPTFYKLGDKSVSREEIKTKGHRPVIEELSSTLANVLYSCIDDLDATLRELTLRRLDSLGICRPKGQSA